MVLSGGRKENIILFSKVPKGILFLCANHLRKLQVSDRILP
ncbi:hypothetical protein J2Y02_000121 [Neobacillus drentensis]|nr:hypothetical protein [Neobacillus drentensis]